MEYEIKVPQAGFSITEGTIVQWHKGVGQRVQEGETVVSIETDKVVVEIPAQCMGVLIEIKHEVGETVPIGSVLGMIREEGGEKFIPAGESRGRMEKRQEPLTWMSRPGYKEEACSPTESISAPDKKRRKITPLARAIAEREGIDLSKIQVGSGPEGRIVKEDVLSLVHKKEAVESEIKKPRRCRVQQFL
jgi:pyruvate/2-oxoglutarate dehydrogenase complex dihydrolipoamide acyltransferase (E2) component